LSFVAAKIKLYLSGNHNSKVARLKIIRVVSI
jgi:hypothetical protein